MPNINKGSKRFTYLGKDFSNRFGDDFFNVNIEKWSVEGTACCDQHAVYEITIRKGKEVWTVNKRYKEFDMLKQNSEFEDVDFPSKTYFPSLDPGFIESRRVLLQKFLDMLLHKSSAAGKITKESQICKFLNFQ